MNSPHPLQGAFDRVDRAEKHLAELDAEQLRFGKIYHDQIVVERELEPPQKLQAGWSEPPEIPVVWGILTGEIIYNLRAALDYLIYELALRDSGVIQNGTQFPICDDVSGFNRVAPKFLIGLNANHRTAIEGLQPYSGCDWTVVLRDISNPDKHRRLTTPSFGFAVRMTTMSGGAQFSTDGKYGPPFRSKRRAPGLRGEEVDVYLSTEAPIIVEIGGRPKTLVKEIDQLKTSVRDTLEAFKPEF